MTAIEAPLRLHGKKSHEAGTDATSAARECMLRPMRAVSSRATMFTRSCPLRGSSAFFTKIITDRGAWFFGTGVGYQDAPYISSTLQALAVRSDSR